MRLLDDSPTKRLTAFLLRLSVNTANEGGRSPHSPTNIMHRLYGNTTRLYSRTKCIYLYILKKCF